jgi:RsiW-degrading membrane proteinase PrsW (M82 family)
MTGEDRPTASLQRLPHRADGSKARYVLVANQNAALGRDPSCQIVIDSNHHTAVSRRHAEVRPALADPSETDGWWLCDLNSANGTYLNGQRLHGCKLLRSGDRITLGYQGPEFTFALEPTTLPPRPVSAARADKPASQLAMQQAQVRSVLGDLADPTLADPTWAQPRSAAPITLSQLFPIFSTGLGLRRKAYLWPALVTVGFVVSLFVAVGHPIGFNLLLATYLALAAYYLVYRLCGKRKPWWVLLAAATLSMLLIRSPLLPLLIGLFRGILPGQVPQPDEAMPFWNLLVRMFFGAGLLEELLKALPLLILWAVGRRLRGAWSERVGIGEPLDGILLGAASAVGFTLLETLGQYVPDLIQNTTLQVGASVSQDMGLQLLIPRLLGAISGHMAYSGYFGYFIGLAALRPDYCWRVLGVGYLTAALLHALWNTMGAVSPLLLALSGMLSYGCLAAAILKARSLSPTRAQNFATQFKR